MRIRLRIGEEEDRQHTNVPPADLLFQRALIPKYSPVRQYLFPIALYCVCALLHFHGGRELWEKYSHRHDDLLSAETRRNAGRLSLSFLGSIALHTFGAILLIPVFEFLVSLQPEVAQVRSPLIQPILVKMPSRIVLPPNAGDRASERLHQGRGSTHRPNAGNDSSVAIRRPQGAAPARPALKANQTPRDTGYRQPTRIAELQSSAPQPERPPVVLWTEAPNATHAPRTTAPANTLQPPAALEQLLSIQPKRLEIDPSLTVDLARQKNTTETATVDRPPTPDTESPKRQDIEFRVSVGTADDNAEGIRLVTASRKPAPERVVEIVPAGQIQSLHTDNSLTGGDVYIMGGLPADSQQVQPVPGPTGGSGQGSGAFGKGTGSGVGRGNSEGDDAGAKPSVADLLAALELAEPERVRTIIHPEDGAFDLIVTQASLSDVVAGSDGILKGNQINTVYLQVGSPKEWILQYSEFDSRSGKPEPQGESGVYVLEETPSPLSGPYPSVTIRPPSALMPKTAYLLLHGLITSDGTFDKLEVVGTRFQNLLPMLRPSLRKWRFRPASRNGTAVAVEVLLLIPPVTI